MIRVPCKYAPFKCLYSGKCGPFPNKEILTVLDTVDNSIYLLRRIFFEDRKERERYRKKKLKWKRCNTLRDYLFFKSYGIRAVWRLSSFVIIALNTNDLLEDFCRNHKLKSIPAWKETKEIRNDFELMEFYRNKIFAHFAYAKPRKKEEGYSFWITSVNNWHVSGIDNNGLVYLGGSWCKLDEEAKGLPGRFRKHLNIIYAYCVFKNIFKSWYRYFDFNGFSGEKD